MDKFGYDDAFPRYCGGRKDGESCGLSLYGSHTKTLTARREKQDITREHEAFDIFSDASKFDAACKPRGGNTLLKNWHRGAKCPSKEQLHSRVLMSTLNS